AVRNQGARNLLDVVVVGDLTVETPFDRAGSEWVQDHVTPARVIKSVEIATVRISDDGAVAARQRSGQQFAKSRALARAGGADEFEMLGLVLQGDGAA